MIPYRQFTELLESKQILNKEETDLLLHKFNGCEWDVLLYLIKKTDTPPRRWARIWGEAMGVAHVDLGKTLFQSHIVRLLPSEFARRHKVIPLYKLGGVITLATWNTSDFRVLFEAEKIMGCRISPVFALPEEIEYAIEIQYNSTGLFTGGRWLTMEEALGEAQNPDLKKMSGAHAKKLSDTGPPSVTQHDIQRLLGQIVATKEKEKP